MRAMRRGASSSIVVSGIERRGETARAFDTI
jgi:hypothetical protein